MKSIKYLVVLVCMTMGMASIAKAQIYSSEICFYERVSGNSNKSRLCVVKFVDGSIRLSFDNIKSNLEKSKNYYENNDVWDKLDKNKSDTDNYPWKYNTSLSSSYNKEIYFQDYWSFNKYVAFTKDLSSMIMWYEEDGSIEYKCYYTRISKEDILPKSANHDFLYD